jgi:hypothetical protein
MNFFIDAMSKLPDGKLTGRRVGEYWTHDEAVAAAKHVIDAFLFREFRDSAAHGITEAELVERFKTRGEHPVILRKGDSSTNISRFDPLAYAKQRSKEICDGAPKG